MRTFWLISVELRIEIEEIEEILIEEVGIETFDFDVPIELVISFSTEFGVELWGYRYKVVIINVSRVKNVKSLGIRNLDDKGLLIRRVIVILVSVGRSRL